MRSLNLTFEDKAFAKLSKKKKKYGKITWERVIYIAMSRLECDNALEYKVKKLRKDL